VIVHTVAASSIITGDAVLGPSVVSCDQGVIVAIEPATSPTPPRTLIPGCVDLQVNGIDEFDCARATDGDWDALDGLLLRQGVTAWCPTLITARLDSYAAPLERIAAAQSDGRRGDCGEGSARRPTMLGAHLEGPFLGGAPGAHRRELLAAIDHTWLAKLPDVVRLTTLAPELDGAIDAVRQLVERGIVVALGHTTASREQFAAAVGAGATLVTHLFNGMSGVHHREPGVAAFALADATVNASLIADGIHVDPLMLRLAFATLGERAVLVTDAVAWRAGRAGPVSLGMVDGAPRLPDGTLAGSTLTMDAALRTCVAAGVPMEEAVRAASSRPAAVIGRHDLGDLVVGGRADLVALTDDLQVEQTWVAGLPSLPG
jgi:N-acetylglucosamine-6-phosphate deacetylase